MGRIDAHVHGIIEDFSGDPKAYVADCRERGIDAVVLIEPLDRCLKAMDLFGDFIIPVALVDMPKATPAELKNCLDAGCKGIKFIRPGCPYSDRSHWPLYECLESADKPCIFHTGYLGFNGREESPVRIEDMRAAEIDVIARRFPNLRILMAHFSNPWWEEGWKVSMSNENVYADLSGGTVYKRSIAMWADLFAPDGNLLEASIRKLCFASDVHYFGEGDHLFGGHIEFYDRLVDRIGLSDSLKERVYTGNAARLFGV